MGILLAFTAAGLCATARAAAPVLGWSPATGTFSNVGSIRDGVAVPVDEVARRHLAGVAAGKTTTVLFTMDELSVDDLSRYGAESFGAVQAAMAAAKESLVAPSVASADGDVAAELAGALSDGGDVPTIAAEEAADRLSAELAAQPLLVVTLPAVAGAPSRGAALLAGDRLIRTTLAKLATLNVEPVVMLTAAGSGRPEPAARARRDSATYQPHWGDAAYGASALRPERPVSKAMKECLQQWPERTRANDPSFRQNGKGCRNGHLPGKTTKFVLFSTPMLMAISVALFLVFIFCVGMHGIMMLQTNDRFPSVEDIPILVSTLNE